MGLLFHSTPPLRGRHIPIQWRTLNDTCTGINQDFQSILCITGMLRYSGIAFTEIFSTKYADLQQLRDYVETQQPPEDIRRQRVSSVLNTLNSINRECLATPDGFSNSQLFFLCNSLLNRIIEDTQFVATARGPHFLCLPQNPLPYNDARLFAKILANPQDVLRKLEASHVAQDIKELFYTDDIPQLAQELENCQESAGREVRTRELLGETETRTGSNNWADVISHNRAGDLINSRRR